MSLQDPVVSLAMRVPSLVVEGLCVGYGDSVLVENVTFNLKNGEAISLMGPNGSGKTTVLNSLSGWNRPMRGRILVCGTEINSRLPEDIALLGIRRTFQAGRSISGLYPCEYFALMRLGGTLHRLSALVQRASLIDEVMRAELWLTGQIGDTRAADIRSKTVGSLSGGLRRFVGALGVLYSATSVALLDEPFGGLADDLKEILLSATAAILQEGVSAVIVDHDLEAARQIASQILTFSLSESGVFQAVISR